MVALSRITVVLKGAFFCSDVFLTLILRSAMESHSLLNPNLQQGEGVLSSFRTTWQEFVEDLGFWRVLLLIIVIALLSLGIAYYVSGVLPFVENQPELVHWSKCKEVHRALPCSNLILSFLELFSWCRQWQLYILFAFCTYY